MVMWLTPENKRINVLETGEGYFANIDFTGDHLKNLEHNAQVKGLDLKKIVENEIKCAVSRAERMILNDDN